MNGFGQSQFDDFLNFSDLFLLQISLRGNLISLRPRNKTFIGWVQNNHHLFNLTDHFLQPNHLTFKLFLDLIQDKEYALDYFLWKSPDAVNSKPVPSFVRTTAGEGQQKNILFFVKNPESMENIKIKPEEKRFIYQACYFPGLIHNINGPFGTITGRIELLQYKYPEIKEFNEIVRVGYRLQTIIDNVSFKIVNENSNGDNSINLNRFLREELTFLTCDLFFKHQVERVEEFATNIPEFSAHYLSLSGIFSECYQFFRQFVNEQKEYVFIIKSFYQGNHFAFSVDFLGEFSSPGKMDAKLPIFFEGDYIEMARFAHPGLDNRFLSHCMGKFGGILRLSASQDSLKYKFEFPTITIAE